METSSLNSLHNIAPNWPPSPRCANVISERPLKLFNHEMFKFGLTSKHTRSTVFIDYLRRFSKGNSPIHNVMLFSIPSPFEGLHYVAWRPTKMWNIFSFILEILCIILHTNTISSRCSKPQLCSENIRHKRHSKKTCAKIVPLIKLENWFDNADKNTCSQIMAVAIYLVAEAILYKSKQVHKRSTSR